MKSLLQTSILYLVITITSHTFASPIGDIRRSKRALCAESDERCIEDEYWKEVLPLGFFVNSNAVGGGGGAATGSKRAMPGPLYAGSGSGHMIQRSDIPGQKAQNAQASEQTVKTSAAIVKNDVSPPAPAPAPVDTPAPQPTTEKDGNKRKVVFCQEEKEWLQCPMYRVIKINKAFWGRKDHTSCSDKAVTRTLKTEKLCAQDEANTMKKVETMCNDEEACELVASETFFDRADCPDVYKYVELEYECLHREMRIKETGSS